MGKVDQSTTRCRLFASRAGKKEITRVQDSRSVKAEIGNRRILVVSEISLVWIDWKVQLADRQTYCNDTEDLSMLYIRLSIFVIAQEVIKYIALL